MNAGASNAGVQAHHVAEGAPSEVVRVQQGDIEAVVTLGADALRLSITRRNETVLEEVRLGFDLDGDLMGPGSTVLEVSQRTISETFAMKTGKKVGEHAFEHRQARIDLEDISTGREWALLVRVASDGVAFAYGLPSDLAMMQLGAEETAFPSPAGSRAWMLEYQTWYETERIAFDVEDLPSGDYGFPALLREGEAGPFVLITESAIDGNSSGAHLRYSGPEDSRFTVVTADDVTACSAGHQTPWRVFIIGTLDEIVSSSLVDELAPAASGAPGLYDFVRPGRAAWSWWSSQYSGADFEEQKRLVDFAQSQGWEHILVDCGWDGTWVPDLVAYSSARGIQVHLWSKWADLDSSNIAATLGLWRSWGVAGIKVDFMESEAQARYVWYDMVLEATRQFGLMVNFHGSVIPRGWARTHPQVVSFEAVRGAEYYTFYEHPLTAAHNVIQPFTRNVVGSMDYTPVTFSAPRRVTSAGHELGLSVAYESGITHFADNAAEYESRPLVTEFLAELAPFWEETRLLSGTPDTEAVIARRHEDRWFLGCIATGSERSVTIDVADLLSTGFNAWFIHDSLCDGEELIGTSYFDHRDTVITLPIAANGGFAGIIAPHGSDVSRRKKRPIAVGPTISPATARAPVGEPVFLVTQPDALVGTPPGWHASRVDEHAGTWSITAQHDAEPGSTCVVSATVATDRLPVVAHARLFVPHRGTSIPLSTLPMISATNGLGPVERDQSNGGGDPRDGHILTIDGEQFLHGFGVSGHSALVFFLGGDVTSISGFVGIDEETSNTSAVAAILLDGVQQLSMPISSTDAAVPFTLDVRDAQTLELRTVPSPPFCPSSVHIDWAHVYLHAEQAPNSQGNAEPKNH